MNKEEIQELLQQEFPEKKLIVESCENRRARLRFENESVSGLSVMLLADTAVYSAILTTMEAVVSVVRTNLNINFLSKPDPNQDLVGESWLMKVDKSLIVGEVIIYSENDSEPIAHATCTYSFPIKILT
jgi:acyl-coenzyme A thioesterase PaaI-like protein|tara:strand:+ start:724 stop:1110 length:387 start_codon:yes stop_codon:yes gene_type:complete